MREVINSTSFLCRVLVAVFPAPRQIRFGKYRKRLLRNGISVREFCHKINPFRMSVRFLSGLVKQRINVRESLIQQCDKVVFQRNFNLRVMIILPVIRFEK